MRGPGSGIRGTSGNRLGNLKRTPKTHGYQYQGGSTTGARSVKPALRRQDATNNWLREVMTERKEWQIPLVYPFLAWVIIRVDVLDGPGPHPVKLKDRFAFSPHQKIR